MSKENYINMVKLLKAEGLIPESINIKIVKENVDAQGFTRLVFLPEEENEDFIVLYLYEILEILAKRLLNNSNI
jgi:hypothetical protein